MFKESTFDGVWLQGWKILFKACGCLTFTFEVCVTCMLHSEEGPLLEEGPPSPRKVWAHSEEGLVGEPVLSCSECGGSTPSYSGDSCHCHLVGENHKFLFSPEGPKPHASPCSC